MSIKKKHILKSKSFQGIILIIISNFFPGIDKAFGTQLMLIQPYILSLGITWSGIGTISRKDIKII